MKELEQFFKDIHRIADNFEKVVNSTIAMDEKVSELAVDVMKRADGVEQNQVSKETQPIQDAKIQENASNINQDAQMQQAPTGIPVSNTVVAYTQEQLALAMGRAIDAGKMPDIQKILSDFGVSSLVELSADKYNDLVFRLKQIGVDV